MPVEPLTAPASKRSSSGLRAGSPRPALMPVNSSHTAAAADGHHVVDKRDGLTEMTPNWALTYMSVPPRTSVMMEDSEWLEVETEYFKYQRDASQCKGQYVYVVENKFDTEHLVSWPAGSGPFVLLWLLRGPASLIVFVPTNTL